MQAKETKLVEILEGTKQFVFLYFNVHIAGPKRNGTFFGTTLQTFMKWTFQEFISLVR